MAWLVINGNFIDAPAEAARQTDVVLCSTRQQPSCQYFQQHWIKMRDFHPFPSSLNLYFFSRLSASCYISLISSSSSHRFLPLPPPHWSSHPLSTSWMISLWVSVIQQYGLYWNCLFNVNGNQMPALPPFGVIVHLNDSRVIEERKKKMSKGGMPTDVSS